MESPLEGSMVRCSEVSNFLLIFLANKPKTPFFACSPAYLLSSSQIFFFYSS